MGRGILVVALALVYSYAFADSSVTAAKSRQEYCSHIDDLDYYKNLALIQENLMSFPNPHAGIANGGLCWWMSQLQRSSLFLTVYRPDLPKPTNPDEITYLFEAIMKQQAVVEIPGYPNFYEFTADWADHLIQLLADWQISQGVLGFGWIAGLGSDSVDPSDLKSIMDDLYQRVEKQHQIVYTTLKMPGIVAHAWLFVHMAPKDNGGYDLQVLDSNSVSPVYATYEPGSSHFEYFSSGIKFVPRVGRQEDLEAYKKRAQAYCSGQVDPTYKLYPYKQTVRQPQVGDKCKDTEGNSGALMADGQTGQLICNFN